MYVCSRVGQNLLVGLEWQFVTQAVLDQKVTLQCQVGNANRF